MIRPHAVAKRLVLAILLAAVPLESGCASQSTPHEPVVPAGPVRVLMIGNSLTAFNDLPGMLAALLEQAGADPVTVSAVARGNFGLEDHWTQGATFDQIALGWDVVTLQQGPSATEGRPSLIEFARKFAPVIRDAGALPALYMVWPAEARSFDFDGVSDSYSEAARRADALLFPAGEAWRAAWELEPDLPLYGPDRFHPSPLGTYAAAVVMMEQLIGVDPRELPPVIPGYADYATEDQVRQVQAAARTANQRYRREAAP